MFQAHELVDGIRSNDPLATATAEITVRIKDVNDEPPLFNKREYFVEIPENIQEGSALPGLDMVVTDPDEVKPTILQFIYTGKVIVLLKYTSILYSSLMSLHFYFFEILDFRVKLTDEYFK